MVSECPADNRAIVEQEEFWNGQFDAHKVSTQKSNSQRESESWEVKVKLKSKV